MVLKVPWDEKRMFWVYEKTIFLFLANFWVTKSKPFFRKVRQSVQNFLNQNLVIGSFLENGFEVNLGSKANVLGIWKEHFSVLCKFLSDEVETILWESQAKRSKLFNSKFGRRKVVRKVFWSNFELINEYSDLWNRHFWVFCKSLSDKVESILWESQAKCPKLFRSKFG